MTFVTSTDNARPLLGRTRRRADGTLTYTPAPDANGVAHVTVAAVDDGGTANGGHDTSAAQAFTITVKPVNDAPSFVPGASQTVVSLLGAQTVNGWAKAISPGRSDECVADRRLQGQRLAIRACSPSSPQVSSTGKLTYTPKALALGSATVTVTPVDNGGTANGGHDTGASRTFTITIV